MSQTLIVIVAVVVTGVALLSVLGLLSTFVRMSPQRRAVTVVAVFGAAWALDLLVTNPGGGLESVLPAALMSALNALGAFLGNPNLTLGQPGAGSPLVDGSLLYTVITVARFWLTACMLLITVATVAALVARPAFNRFVAQLRRYNVIVTIEGHGPRASSLARALLRDPRPGARQLLARLGTPVITEQEGEEEAGLWFRSPRPLLGRLKRGGDWIYISFDDGTPTYIEGLVNRVEDLLASGRPDGSLRVVAFVQSIDRRDEVLDRGKLGFELRLVSFEELVARDLIDRCHPLGDPGAWAIRGRPDRPFRGLLVASGGELAESLVQQIAVHAQFYGTSPHLTIAGPAQGTHASFDVRYPDLTLSLDLSFVDVDLGSRDFYELLQQDWTHVIVALEDAAVGHTVAWNIERYLDQQDPRPASQVALYSPDSGELVNRRDTPVALPFTLFGDAARLLASATLVFPPGDAVARRVHEYYGGHNAHSSGWDALSYVDQASNRSAADFAVAVHAKLVPHLGDDPDDILAQTEHLRWNAFYRSLGYRTLGAAQMRQRWESPAGRGIANPSERGAFARQDAEHRLHCCLVPWDELDTVSATYNSLVEPVDLPPRDFKRDDRAVMQMIREVLLSAG